MIHNILFLTIIGAFVAAASAYLGSLMILKRMALVGDALTHVALPGIAIAISLSIDPIIGAFVALTLAVVGVWYLEKTSDVYPEALVGVIFTASLALGVLLANEVELFEALFGNIEKLTVVDGFAAIVLSCFVLGATYFLSKKLLIMVVSEEMAKTSGIRTDKINLFYMLLVGLIVSLGIKFVGTLLMGALVIIPAVTAKNLSRSINSYFLFSILTGIISAVIGIIVATNFNLSVGAIVVLVNVVFYVMSIFLKRN